MMRGFRDRSGGVVDRAVGVIRVIVGVATVVAAAPVLIWIAVVLIGLMIFGVGLAVICLDGSFAQIGQDWHYQCDSAVGPDPAVTGTTDPTTDAPTATVTPSPQPTANPYAGMTFSPGDNPSSWDVACVNAMDSAPFQQPPLQTEAMGVAVDCARQLALGSVGKQVSGTPAVLTEELTYQASLATQTGSCNAGAALPSEPAAPASAESVVPTVGSVASTGSCARPGVSGEAVLLPDTVAAQGLCGQRVTITAVSAGDLVFWDYNDYAPTRVGVAVGVEQLVTVDPASGRVVEQSIPSRSDVRVKRVLGSGS